MLLNCCYLLYYFRYVYPVYPYTDIMGVLLQLYFWQRDLYVFQTYTHIVTVKDIFSLDLWAPGKGKD